MKNLIPNPAFRATSGTVEARRNLSVNPAFRATTGTVEVRRNTFVNPVLGTDATGWAATMQTGGTFTATRETAGGPTVGGVVRNFYRMTVSTVTTGALSSTGVIFSSPTADYMLLTPGVANTVSVYTRSSVADRTVVLVVTSHKSDGSNQVVEATSTATAIGGGWTRLSATFTPAAGQVRGYARIYAQGGRTWQVGDTLDATAVLCEAAGAVLPYFDGASAAAAGLTYAWTGTAHSSASTATGLRVASWTGSPSVYADGASGRTLHLQPVPSAATLYQSAGISVAVGERTAHGLTIEVDATSPALTLRLAAITYETSGPNGYAYGTTVTIQPGSAATLSIASQAAVTSGAQVRTVLYPMGSGFPAGASYRVRESIVVTGTEVPAYFDGSTAAASGLTYAWTGTADASASTATAAKPSAWLAASGAVAGRGPALGAGYAGDFRSVTSNVFCNTDALTYEAGAYYSARMTVRAIPGETAVDVFARFHNGTTYISDARTVTLPADGSPVTLETRALAPASGNVRLYIYPKMGTSVRVTDVVAAKVAKAGDPAPAYFDGNSTGARWEGTAELSRSLLPSLTATYDPDYVRVGLQGEDWIDGTPVDLTRDGETVRGGKALVPSSGAFFVWDYEARLNAPLAYLSSDGTRSSAASVTIPVTDAWLRAPGLPSLDMPVLPREVPQVARPRPTATLRPLGRRRPVVLSGTRSAGEFTLNLWTQNDEEADALQTLIEEAATALLLMPGARAVDRVYVALGDAEEVPLTGFRPAGTEDWTLWTVAATVVDSPIGGVFGDPTASYQALVDTYSTYSALQAAHPTYLSVLRGV